MATMSRATFSMSVARRRLIVVFAVLCLSLSIANLWIYSLLGGTHSLAIGLYLLIFGAWFVWAGRRRSLPIVEVTSESVTFGSPFGLRPKTLPIGEIKGIKEIEQLGKLRNLKVRTTSGRSVKIPLRDLPAKERRAVATKIRTLAFS